MLTRYLLTSIISLLLLTACGNKGPVRPLEVPLPGTVQAPELRQQGDSLLLGWQLPTTNQDGSPLTAAPIVDIYRMTYDPADDCPECFDRSSLLVSINPQLPTPAQKVGQRFLFYDRPLTADTGYQYKLIARNQDDEQSRPVILRQAYRQPLPAPLYVTATPRDRAALLEWQAPPLLAGDELLGYLIYRRSNGIGSPYPLQAEPLQSNSFEDFSLDNGTTYQYRISALVRRGKQQLEGRASQEVSVTPQAGI
jgi:predicted small lipoprotein YifL